jgi:hypothetical protein
MSKSTNKVTNRIYTFKLNKTTKEKVEVSRKNKETGEEETVIQNKNINVPVEVVLHKPSRRMIDEAEIFYAVEMSKAVKKGILTKAMLVKKYADTGGTLTEDETTDLLRVMKDYNDLKNEYQLLKSKKEDEKRQKELEVQMLKTNRQILELESALQGVYQHTADARAERSLIMWYIINLSNVKIDGRVEDFFDGAVYEDQVESFYDKDENGEKYEKTIIDNLMKATSFWFYNQNATQKEIDEFIKYDGQ